MIEPREIVELVFRDGHKCADCSYAKRWTEGHGEQLRECHILEDGLEPTLCPGFEGQLERELNDD